MSSLGDRLAAARKRRGLTQSELASLAGVSLSLIRKIEQGERPDTRLETLRKIAKSLGVATTTLIGERQSVAGSVTDPQWQQVMRAMTGQDDATGDPLPTTGGLDSAVTAAVRLYHLDNYRELATVLLPLVTEANALVAAQEDEASTALALRARVMQVVGSLATQTRHFKASELALGIALRDAQDTGDDIEAASAVITQCWLLLRQGKLDEARELATLWADRIEPRMSRATDREVAAWGWLLLRGSAAAIRDNRASEAEDFMRLALAGAVRIGREHGSYHEYFTTFGPATVQMKNVENAIIDANPAKALRLAQQIPQAANPTSDNLNRHLLDVAYAHVQLRQYGQALELLSRIRWDAPEWLPHQRYAHDILATITGKRRTLTDEMRDLADFMGLDL
ncbi:helix-turn-helix domain-containing protein [Acrocarpospora catenulata]|uniref:helix-turn-helix domain-containing protein n=1 Tax=Acrocarpospora catenulata TaxID=2836182 RepID=UPI001BDB5B7D|nr:helix-turn-helix domain-containing protein [Acrocarpospora catenulata]